MVASSPKKDSVLDDARVRTIRDENFHYQVSQYKSKEEWIKRAEYLRRHILVCCGLWPPPEKTPLNPRVFGRTERNDYAVEKVYFESYPGFFITGNLYSPLNKRPPFPAVLCPHGHWKHGRLEDSDLCSVPGRCINFAKQGYVAFSHDMVGFMDSLQIGHDFGSSESDALWGVNLTGLQLWNSIRSIDFLQRLDIVDPELIGCTGASGGGTQTFLLTAVDERISASAPVCMVSSHFQGGCLCENPPNLRVETFNVEIAALAAPRPLLLVSATGDWTRDTPVCGYPSIMEIYRLFNAEDKVKNVHVDASHNYNKESREAVYLWFGKWLLGEESEKLLHEQPFEAESLPKLLVFYGIPTPMTEIDPVTQRKYLVSKARETLSKLEPEDFEGLKEYRKILGEVYKHSLLAYEPREDEVQVSVLDQTHMGKAQVKRLILSRKGIGDKVPTVEIKPVDEDSEVGALIVHEEGKQALLDIEKGKISPLVNGLINRGQTVLLIDCFATGEYSNINGIAGRGRDPKFFTTYNRTNTAERVQDILTGISYLSKAAKLDKVNIVGMEEAGLWCLLARGLAEKVDSTVVDVNEFNLDDEEEWLRRLFVPLIRRAGGLEITIALAAPSKLFLHNCKSGFKPDFATELYERLNASKNLKIKSEKATDVEIVKWMI